MCIPICNVAYMYVLSTKTRSDESGGAVMNRARIFLSGHCPAARGTNFFKPNSAENMRCLQPNLRLHRAEQQGKNGEHGCRELRKIIILFDF